MSLCLASRTTTTTAALIAVKIGLCLSPLRACRLQFGFYSAIFCCSVLVVVVTVAIAVLFNYNYLFNHNFVRVSTIINHQMHHADSGRQNSVTGPTVSLTDWPLSAREQRAGNRRRRWSCCPAWSSRVECAACLSLSFSFSFCWLLQLFSAKSSVSVSGSRTPQLSSQQSVSQSAR